jgi:hypothetical protein
MRKDGVRCEVEAEAEVEVKAEVKVKVEVKVKNLGLCVQCEEL